MRKTNESIYNIVLASIKRHSMDIETWDKTKLWQSGDNETKSLLLSKCGLGINELPILYVWINQATWTLFTTMAIYYSNDENVEKIEISDIQTYEFDVGKFKGIDGNLLDFMIINTKTGRVHKFLYETGKPSMAAIYGIQTLVQIS